MSTEYRAGSVRIAWVGRARNTARMSGTSTIDVSSTTNRSQSSQNWSKLLKSSEKTPDARGPDRRRSGLHPKHNLLQRMNELRPTGGGVPLRRGFTATFAVFPLAQFLRGLAASNILPRDPVN